MTRTKTTRLRGPLALDRRCLIEPLCIAALLASVANSALAELPTTSLLMRTDAGDQLGAAVACIGDVNGDGIPDIVVGAPQPVLAGKPGYADVISGRDGALLFRLMGEAPGDCFGISVDGAGDVDHDGCPDIIVGAFNWHAKVEGLDKNGYARVCSGRDGHLLWELHGDATTEQFGRRVAHVGNINSDGYGDFAVAASPSMRFLNGPLGHVRVFSGRTGLLMFDLPGHDAMDDFGESISSAGDLDGDGTPDILVGAPYGEPNDVHSGFVCAFSGKNGSLLFELKGSQPREEFGVAVCGGRDIDGDGKPDFLVASEGNSEPLKKRVSAYSGATHSLLFTIPADAYFSPGRVVAFAGDYNHDGHEDILVANPDPKSGVVRVYSGADGSTVLSEFRSDAPFAQFGAAVCSLGDVNGDNIPDLAIGAHCETLHTLTTGSFAIGRVTVVSGGDHSPIFSKLGGH